MNDKLEDKIIRRFPQLFPNGKDVDKTKSLMYFGFSHNDGWFDIIWNLCLKIEEIIGDKYTCTVIQVKEKFGTLRFYYENCSTEIRDEVNAVCNIAEQLTAITCEQCGKEGKSHRDGFLVHTSCDDCREKYLRGRKGHQIN